MAIITKWFCETIQAITMCKEVLSFKVFTVIGCSAFEKFMKVMERVLFVVFTCVLALGGSIIGSIAGAIKGQTTETGFLEGACKGALAGAIAAIELMSFGYVGEPFFSKVALLRSLLSGKMFMEWTCPSVAQAYINSVEAAYGEMVSDIYDNIGVKGMPQIFIMKLPFYEFSSNKIMKIYNESCCSICFQEFEDGELVRTLPKCCHIYHLECIDKWLVQQGSCPICRTYILE